MNKYSVKHEIISINNIQYDIRSLKDRQQFNDDEQKAEALGISSASWPLFGIVWPSARVLASTVCLSDLKGKRVLEIGCGIGLSSIVLHNMGIDITASDYHPLAREFMDQNIANNNLLPIKFDAGNWENRNPLLGEFDLIIGSDILYEPAHAELVSQFISTHSNSNVEVMIVDPNRGNRAKFTREMIALGYTHNFDYFNVEGADDVRCKGRILHYQREPMAA